MDGGQTLLVISFPSRTMRGKGDSLPHDATHLLAQTKRLLREFGLHARKGLGQHFLIDAAALDASVRAAELEPTDTVVEVGPGLGVLTARLAESAGRVIAIELDPAVASMLSRRFSDSPRVTILTADILELDLESLWSSSAKTPYKVVANLPFYIAAPTIRRFLEAPTKPTRMVIMVQREVAENICAGPGRLSILGLSVQFYGLPTVVRYVPARSFYPAPKVDSAIVRIDVYEHPPVEVPPEAFFRVVKAGFSAPRKQLRNSLAHGLGIPPAQAGAILDRANVDPTRRAQTLSLKEWEAIVRVVGGELT